jgi:hypothetical protein
MNSAPGETESCLIELCWTIVNEREGEVVLVTAERGHLRDRYCLFVKHSGQTHKQQSVKAHVCDESAQVILAVIRTALCDGNREE